MTTRLPVITGFGGYSAAGRSSFHHAYRRTVIESLSSEDQLEVILGLACLMNLVEAQADGSYRNEQGESLDAPAVLAQYRESVLAGTLVRRIEKQHFDVDAMVWQKSIALDSAEQAVSFETRKRQLPEPVPENWLVEELEDGQVKVTITGTIEAKIDSVRDCPVKSAGQIPEGFVPGDHYNARFHPRALQLAVLGASDAINSLGLDWAEVVASVEPDQIGTYSGNVMSQLDDDGFGGMMKARLKGGRVSTKQCPLGLNTMPADFVNAYVLGSVGHTQATIGACATFLYNLEAAVKDIRSGKIRVAVVGNAEAPIVPEVIDGYATMGALASEDKLKKLDGGQTDLRKTSRPFAENCGFTIAESSQYVVLMDDELAMELGADIHAAVGDVFINADGFKKSISAPGAGNYITMAKAVASARAMVGSERISEASFVQAHGSSTPQNRVTESEIFDRIAETFDISSWPVAAVKAYVGHSLAPASADQLVSTLGIFKHGVVPGIKTANKLADDISDQRLSLSVEDQRFSQNQLQVAFLNSKGFGGNNATASVLAPQLVETMLEKRYGSEQMAAYIERREQVRDKARAYDRAATNGELSVIYKFGENMIDESAITLSADQLTIPGFSNSVDLNFSSPYGDMLDPTDR